MINNLNINSIIPKKPNSRIKLTEKVELLNSAHVLYSYMDKNLYIENLFSFINAGVELGHSVHIIDSQDHIGLVVETITARGDSDLLEGVTFTDNMSHYITNKKLDLEKALSNVKALEVAFNADKNPIRIWRSLQGIDFTDYFGSLKAYEYMLELLVSQVKSLTICAYDANMISGALLIEIMKSHEYIMTDRELYSSSLFVKNTKGQAISIVDTIDKTLYEYKKYKDEMVRLERFNMVSQMATTISHEVKNPLTTTRGFLQLFMNKEEYKQDWNFFGIMIEELDRANTILTEFLALSQDKPTKFELQCLNTIIESVSSLVNVMAVETEKVLELDLNEIPMIAADEDEIRQVVFNLLKNGLDAMPAGGVINVTTFQEHGDVFLEINDQGDGIGADIMEKIGTPFISSKKDGTGLGLATTYSILERHKARVDVITGPNGTTFLIRFKSFYKTAQSDSSRVSKL